MATVSELIKSRIKTLTGDDEAKRKELDAIVAQMGTLLASSWNGTTHQPKIATLTLGQADDNGKRYPGYNPTQAYAITFALSLEGQAQTEFMTAAAEDYKDRGNFLFGRALEPINSHNYMRDIHQSAVKMVNESKTSKSEGKSFMRQVLDAVDEKIKARGKSTSKKTGSPTPKPISSPKKSKPASSPPPATPPLPPIRDMLPKTDQEHVASPQAAISDPKVATWLYEEDIPLRLAISQLEGAKRRYEEDGKTIGEETDRFLAQMLMNFLIVPPIQKADQFLRAGNLEGFDRLLAAVKTGDTALVEEALKDQPFDDVSRIAVRKVIIDPSPIAPPITEQKGGITPAAQIIGQAEAELILPEANKTQIAFDTYRKLMAASGKNAEQLAKLLDQDVSSPTLRLWTNKSLKFDTLVRVVDRIAVIFIPHDVELAKRAANIMMGLGWSQPKNFQERMQYAIEHKQSAYDFLNTFRYQEREPIAKAWQTVHKTESRKYEAIDAFHTYLQQGLPADVSFSYDQLSAFKRRQDLPNTKIINHVASRVGACTPQEKIMFRKLTYQYPMHAGQSEVYDALASLEKAGNDKDKRKSAFKQLEQAITIRDGFRPKGYREEMVQYIFDHAHAHDVVKKPPLLPPEGAIDKKTIVNTWGTLVKKGGETTDIKARLIAAYVFSDDESAQTRCINAFSPHHFVEAEAGQGNKFRARETPFRPSWSYEATMQAKAKKSGKTERE